MNVPYSGRSSARIVPVAVVLPSSTPPNGFERFRRTVSLGSTFVSPLTVTSIVALVWLGAKLSVVVGIWT